ncbi:MAG: hypothetical protein H5T86_10265 [Armatimonadetes bacterium]|nr:hypothetical protein [Armatimonadota bacterium]
MYQTKAAGPGLHLWLVLLAGAGLLCFGVAACADNGSPPPPPIALYYDMDFSGNGQRDNGDWVKCIQFWKDFRSRGSLTTQSRKADVYTDGRLDYRDARLLVEEWLAPAKVDLPVKPSTASVGAAHVVSGGATGKPRGAADPRAWLTAASDLRLGWRARQHFRIMGRSCFPE